MSKSEAMRSLAKEGLTVAEIAKRVGVRYQFVRNVLLRAGLLSAKRQAGRVGPRAGTAKSRTSTSTKPRLTVSDLTRAGFELASRWQLKSDGQLELERALPAGRGVYAMVKNDKVQYVGLATMGIAKRLKFYVRPGKTQRTSVRINAILKTELGTTSSIDIYTAFPPNFEWNGLPVSGMAGLELGLIEAYRLPWNIRGVRVPRSRTS